MIRNAKLTDLPVLTELALELWPDHSADKMYFDLGRIMTAGESVFFLAYEEELAVGFAQCQLRHDYVEGCETNPVGFLEGIYVDDAHRRSGVARALLSACEAWARSIGCSEFASDCEIDNHNSLAWHLKNGFTEMGRTIWFAKKL